MPPPFPLSACHADGTFDVIIVAATIASRDNSQRRRQRRQLSRAALELRSVERKIRHAATRSRYYYATPAWRSSRHAMQSAAVTHTDTSHLRFHFTRRHDVREGRREPPPPSL